METKVEEFKSVEDIFKEIEESNDDIRYAGEGRFRFGGVNRTMCSVLDAIRDIDKTKNYAPLLGMVEELQYMANKMESALYDQKDLKSLTRKYDALKAQYKRLLIAVNALKPPATEKLSKSETD